MDCPLTIKGGVIFLCLAFGWGGNASRQNASGQTALLETWASWSIVIFYSLPLSTCGSEDLNHAEAHGQGCVQLEKSFTQILSLFILCNDLTDEIEL